MLEKELVLAHDKYLLINGDCAQELSQLPDNSVDLIVTSPPYTERRQDTYGGIAEDKYVEWFMVIANQLKRVLKRDGTFILNIKEHARDLQLTTYVMELVIEMKKSGWVWTEHFIWHKTSTYPGRWKNRFRNAWESCFQFNKTTVFNMYQERVRVPQKLSTKKKAVYAKRRDDKLGHKYKGDKNNTGSPFLTNISGYRSDGMAYPTNVITMASECGNKDHPATFSDTLPAWFIKLFTNEGDLVLDPFMGSGTTNKMALKMLRKTIGIEVHKKYFISTRQAIVQQVNQLTF